MTRRFIASSSPPFKAPQAEPQPSETPPPTPAPACPITSTSYGFRQSASTGETGSPSVVIFNQIHSSTTARPAPARAECAAVRALDELVVQIAAIDGVGWFGFWVWVLFWLWL
ncbi:hypothetical protein BDW42DRAFT_172515 [Aspergillus taichungensis]|uniref:Uncharacterized protein n=1 Tax=Aspergillus taichungensis TaxID=482145 RepID=A0A2J5HQL5_9EURO|nr:hypothetical protein BDW42DRAFT_172515 [Aspergillus taichungensis]